MSDWNESPAAARQRWHTEARERDELAQAALPIDDSEADDSPWRDGPEPDDTTLWAVHIQGSDEYIAAASRKDAVEIKAQLDHFDAANTHRANFPKANAQVVPWPHDAASHAESLETEEAIPGQPA